MHTFPFNPGDRAPLSPRVHRVSRRDTRKRERLCPLLAPRGLPYRAPEFNRVPRERRQRTQPPGRREDPRKGTGTRSPCQHHSWLGERASGIPSRALATARVFVASSLGSREQWRPREAPSTSRTLQGARAESLTARLTRLLRPRARRGHTKTKRPRERAGAVVFLVHETPASRPANGPDARTPEFDSARNRSTHFFRHWPFTIVGGVDRTASAPARRHGLARDPATPAGPVIAKTTKNWARVTVRPGPTKISWHRK